MWATGCINMFDWQNSHIFYSWFFEISDFCLNWLHKYAPILQKHFFFLSLADFFKFAIFHNCFRKYANISSKIFKSRTSFGTGCWKIKLFCCWFFFLMHDLLCKYAIILSKIGKIHVFMWFVFTILSRMILYFSDLLD